MIEGFLEPLPEALVQFRALPTWRTIILPATSLTPHIVDDWTSSHTEGPIEAYMLHKYETSGALRSAIWIADGHHRYFEKLREAQFRANMANLPFKAEDVLLEVMKVIPHRDNDIRYILNATDWLDEEQLRAWGR